MFSPPRELGDDALAEGLEAGWGIRAADLSYLAVGFGSHHWVATDGDGRRWFVTVDDLREGLHSPGDSVEDAARRLATALGLARRLHDGGASFVVAPERARNGSILRRVNTQFCVAVYPFLDARAPGWDNFTDEHRMAVTDLLARLHEIRPPANVVDGLDIANRHVLDAALDDLEAPWSTGPYAEPARQLLRDHVRAVRTVVAHYDAMAASASAQHERVVITHGEPHAGNVMFVAERALLIDWDTATTSLPERDIWMLETGDGSVSERYRDATGTRIDKDNLELFRLLWDLMEIAEYVRVFRSPHVEDPNALQSWNNFQKYIDVEVSWPHLITPR